MKLASDEAQRCGAARINSQYVLLGLIKEGGGVAVHALKRLNVDSQAVETTIAEMTSGVPIRSPPDAAPNVPRRPWTGALGALRRWMASTRLPPDSETKMVIERAMREARTMRHNYVGTEHLLLGLLDEPECTAAKVIAAHGLKRDEIRREILSVLGQTI